MHLRIGQVLQIGLSPFGCKEDVVLPPEDYGSGLSLAQKPLPLRVELDISSIIIEKVHLYTARVGPLHEAEVHVPVIGTDQFGTLVAVEIYGLDRLKLEQACHTLLALRSTFLPKCIAQPCPRGGEANFIRVGILNNKPLQRIGVTSNHAEADRAAVILDEEPVAIEALLREEARRDVIEPIKRVGKTRRIRHVAVTEPGIVRCDEVKAVGQCW